MKTFSEMINNYSLDVFRVLNGTSLLAIAISFFQDNSFLAGFLWSGPLPFLTFILCHLAVATHFAGGIAIITGFVTRIAAIAQLPFVLGAMCLAVLSDATAEQLWALNLAPLIFLSLLAQIALGSGKLSVDILIGLETESIQLISDDDSDAPQLITRDALEMTPNEEDDIECARRLVA